MTTFVNTTNPYLRILDPATGDYIRFIGGKLEIEEDDPRYPIVATEAARNPNIQVLVNATTCPDCGQVFTGKAGKAQLGKHRKEVHFEKWLADKEAADAASTMQEVKARAGIVCDVCAPVQTFASKEELAVHVKALHEQAPEMDAEGNSVGQPAEG